MAGQAAPKQSRTLPPSSLCLCPLLAVLEKWGRNELPEKVTPKWLIVFRLLTGPMPMMLWIALIIEAIIGNYADMGILLGIQLINAAISFYETTKAADAVAALKASLKPKATVKRDGKWADIDATLVVPGDLVLLAAGSAIPADSFVNHGEIEVDQSAMTGESLPAKFRRGELCKMGSSVVRGETEGTVETTGANTFFGKTAAMLQSVDNAGGSLQTLLTKIMVSLVGVSLVLCCAAFGFLVAEGRSVEASKIAQSSIYLPKPDQVIVKESLSFAVVLLVASIPVAIEIVTTTTLALGSRYLSSEGAIVTRLTAIEEMAGMDMLCSDKTGTLTLNKMVIQDDCPTYTEGENRETVLFQAALAAKWREPPRDALDTMVLVTAGQDLKKCDVYKQLDFSPFDPRIKRTEGYLEGPDGRKFKITKGAPHVILGLCHNKEMIEKSVEDKVHELGKRGIRSLAVARMNDDDGKWFMLGILTFLDPPRPDTKHTIEECHRFGVAVKMVTGDHHVIAVETARVLGMGTNIQGSTGLPVLGEGGKVPDNLQQYDEQIIPADGFAGVFPEHKYLIVENLRQAGFRCGMTGDGVNDAPALKRADVGIAVQGATDAACAAADIVLTNEGLSIVIDAIKLSREIFARLKNFILYRISATLQLLTFFFISVFALRPVHYYESNFCPSNLQPNQCWAAAAPLETSTLFNKAAFEASVASTGLSTSLVAPVYLKPTSRDCPLTPGTGVPAPGCGYNPNLSIHDEEKFLSKSDGTVSDNRRDCIIYDKKCVAANKEWPDFFQLPVLMLMLITLLNDGTLISIGYDWVKPNKRPERWMFTGLFFVATVLGAVACGSSLLLLWAALDSNNPNGAFAGLGLPPIEYGKIVTLIYAKVSISDFLTLFSARTQGEFFWHVTPSPVLAIAASISLIISTVLACAWPEGDLDGLPVMGLALGEYKLLPLWVWIYCIIFWFIQDAFKVATIVIIDKYRLFYPKANAWVERIAEDTAKTHAAREMGNYNV